MRDVWIAIPAYTGMIHLGTMRSIVTDMLTLAGRGDKVTIFDESGNAMIGDCRGLIVAQFLAGPGTDLVFVDADVTWEAGSLVKLVDRPADFVAGVYPQRRDPLNFCVSWKPGDLYAVDPVTGRHAEDGVISVNGVPAGFMRMSRTMLEKMVAAYPDLNFYCDVAPDKTVCGLFESYWLRGVRIGERTFNLKLGEDYAFCRRWTDLGGEIWIEPAMRMGHVGYKTFIGCIGDWLRSQNGIATAR